MFYKFRCAVARFMYGRNGVDQMWRILFWVYLAVCILRAIIVSVTKSAILAGILDLLTTALAVYLLFRIFSKNLPKRREENQRFLNWFWKAKSNAAGAKARLADNDHKYFTCKCGAVCRVPVGKGKIVITCPKCGQKINAKT